MWPYVGKPLKIRQSRPIQDLHFPVYVIDFTYIQLYEVHASRF
jgi:hypothetical protein